MRTVDDYDWVSLLLKQYYTKNIKFHENSQDLEAILKANPRLVCAVNHGPAPAPFIIMAGVLDSYLKHGGADRKPVIVAWRGFYKVPILRKVFRYLTQAPQNLTAEEYLSKLEEEGYTDLFVMPEGENCVFGDGDHIAPFLSPRFIELALRADVPVLIIVHSGTEAMSLPFTFSDKELRLFKWIPKRQYQTLKETRTLALPRFGYNAIDQLTLSFQLYHPELKLEDLVEDKEERHAQLMVEAQRVREIMIRVKDELEGRKPLVQADGLSDKDARMSSRVLSQQEVRERIRRGARQQAARIGLLRARKARSRST